jgi:hypothetical protein
METVIIFVIGFLSFLNLYFILKSIEYRESIKSLNNEVESLRGANKNLAKIIQEDLDKKAAFEAGCG